MNVLVLGSGGREHALVWKLAQSSLAGAIYTAPGNAGTASIGTNITINPNDFQAVKEQVLKQHIDLLVVGPEEPLVRGIHDFFLNDPEIRHIPVIGPTAAGAQLEGSKEFAKEFMKRHAIPTAAYESFTAESLKEGYRFLEGLPAPYVLKADGLAAGKGVLILEDLNEAKQELKSMLTESRFGEASSKVVIEAFLDGIELSVFALTDGQSYKILPSAKDYKRIGEGDTGPNTGGMGAVSPVPFADDAFMDKIEQKIIKPTIQGLQEENIPYKGFIFFGLIKVGDEPFVIEYNVRMGDPETEVVMPRIKSDLLELLKGVADNTLHEKALETDEHAAATIMIVSEGYPGSYEKGKVIPATENGIQDSIVFHAGTRQDEGLVRSNGGRVFAVSSLGKDIREALDKSYENVPKLAFEKSYYRKDIGFDLF